MDFMESDIQKEHYRWRLCNGKLPLYERHLRSFRTFGMSTPLESWIRARLEWTLENMVSDNPNGVLCIDVDGEEMVTIKVEPARKVPKLAFSGELLDVDEEYTADSLGQPWSSGAGKLVHYGPVLSATNTLTRDLVKTLGYDVEEAAAEEAFTRGDDEERFRISDEFYVVPQGEAGSVTNRMTQCFDKLLKNASSDAKE